MRLSHLIAPPERQLLELLERASTNALRAADLLDELIHHHPERPELRAAILVSEQEGDRLTREVAQRLNESFVAPIEPDDVLELAHAVDDVVDLVEEVADLVGLYGVRRMRHDARGLSRVLLDATRELDAAMPKLERMADASAHTTAVVALEREGDRLVRQAIASLFSEETDPFEVIRWKDLFERLEAAIDACRRVATLLDAIRAKNR